MFLGISEASAAATGYVSGHRAQLVSMQSPLATVKAFMAQHGFVAPTLAAMLQVVHFNVFESASDPSASALPGPSSGSAVRRTSSACSWASSVSAKSNSTPRPSAPSAKSQRISGTPFTASEQLLHLLQ